MAMPSWVEVPLPSSSMTTREDSVADARMADVSDSSSRKVLRPWARLSLAPMRVCTASIALKLKDSAGTKDPTCTHEQLHLSNL